MHDFRFRKTNWLKSAGLAVLLAVLFPAHAAEKTTYFHFDALGSSPVAASDQAGNVVWKEEYRPYGARIKQAPAASSNTRWYTGHPQDDDTGLTYMGARYYDPVVGRFMATDPKGFTADNLHSFNRYAYANNNPYKFVDPDGREALAFGDLPENPVAGAGTAITAGIIASPLLFTVGGVVVAKEAVSHVTGIPLGLKGLLQGMGKGFAKKAPQITKAYTRPSGATTKAQRQSVQGKPCVDCGKATSKQFADHKDPLVKEYYENGVID